MRNSAPSLFEVMQGGRSDNPKVADPTPYLDSLLHKVMVTGDPDLDIPPEVVEVLPIAAAGFSRRPGGCITAVSS